MMDMLTNKDAMDFIAKVEEPFKSLPHLPKGLVEFFVKLAPWFAIIGAVLSLLAGPLWGLVSVLSLFSLNPMLVIFTVVSAIVTLLNAVLLFMAFTPLKNREMKGWILIFWSNILGAVVSLLSIFTGGPSGAVGAVIGILIGLYVLFEMKPFYTHKAA